jgi:hypothetical protein
MSSNSNSNREVKRQKAANSSNRPRIPKRGRKKPANASEFEKQLLEQPKPKKSILPTPEEVRNHLKSNN